MNGLVSALAPFALAGVFLPTWTLFVIVVLGTKRPMTNALAFVAGNAAFRMALGLTALFITGTFPVPGPSDDPSRPQAVGLAIAAAALFLFGLSRLRSPEDPQRPLPGWMLRFEQLGPAAAFTAGVVTVASPGIQWVYLLGAVSVIDAANLTTAEQAFVLLGLVLFLQLMLCLPIAVYALAPSRSTQLLGSLKLWINGHSNRVTGAILVALSVYFATRSGMVLLS